MPYITQPIKVFVIAHLKTISTEALLTLSPLLSLLKAHWDAGSQPRSAGIEFLQGTNHLNQGGRVVWI